MRTTVPGHSGGPQPAILCQFYPCPLVDDLRQVTPFLRLSFLDSEVEEILELTI